VRKIYLRILRDYCAAQAMKSFLVLPAPDKLPEWAKGMTVAQFIARRSYIMADAMLESRKL
jgi:hypothetical protein